MIYNLQGLKREFTGVQGAPARLLFGMAILIVGLLPFASIGFLVLMLVQWWGRNP